MEYIAHTQQNQKVNLIIDKLAEGGEEIIIWGAGNYTSRLLAASNLSKCNIVMLVDKDIHKQETRLSGKPVCAPYTILNMQKRPKILVAAAVFHDEIIAEIKNMVISNKVVVLQ